MKLPHLSVLGAIGGPVLVLCVQNFDWWYNAQLFQNSARPVQSGLADVLWNNVYYGPVVAAAIVCALLGHLIQLRLDERRDMAEVEAYLKEKRSKKGSK